MSDPTILYSRRDIDEDSGDTCDGYRRYLTDTGKELDRKLSEPPSFVAPHTNKFKGAHPGNFSTISLTYPTRPGVGDSIQSYLLLPIFIGLCPYLFSSVFGAETFWMEFSFLALVLFWLYLNSTVPWNLYAICVSRRQDEITSTDLNLTSKKITFWQILEFISIVGLFATPFIAAYGVVYFQNYYSDRFGIGLLSTFNIHLFVLAGLIIPLRYFFGVGYPTRITRESAPAFAPRNDAAILPLPPTYYPPTTQRHNTKFDGEIIPNDLKKRISNLEKEIRSLQTSIGSLKQYMEKEEKTQHNESHQYLPRESTTAEISSFVYNFIFYYFSFIFGLCLIPFKISKYFINLLLEPFNKHFIAKYSP